MKSSASLTRATATRAASSADDSAMDAAPNADTHADADVDAEDDAAAVAEAGNDVDEFIEFSMASGTLVSLRCDETDCVTE